MQPGCEDAPHSLSPESPTKLRPFPLYALILAFAVALGVSCTTTSAESQRAAAAHQYKAEQAADRGFYGVAAEEQRKAADAHYEAVKKAIDEGKPLPPQPMLGDANPDGGF